VDISDEELSIILRMGLLSNNKGEVSKSIFYYKDVISKADEEYQIKILSHALFELSKIYEYDESTADAAFDYLVQAADYGHAGAMFQLGSIYATGISLIERQIYILHHSTIYLIILTLIIIVIIIIIIIIIILISIYIIYNNLIFSTLESL
jgi:hypothetical protein